MHYREVIRRPVITEKSTQLAEEFQYVFEVDARANKHQIKEAVEALFGVKVKAVNTTITKGKNKRFGQTLGKRSDTRKAYVRLKEGQEIDLMPGA